MSYDTRTQAENHFLDINRDQAEDTNYERTEMLIGPEVTTKQTWEFFSNVDKKVDGCASSEAIPFVTTAFADAYKEMKRRGIKIRSVTDITKDNLEHCKTLMQYSEVRHISHLNANFGVSETEYIVAPTMKDSQPLPKLIYSNSKEMIEQQQNIFDIFWSRATPAEQRIKEIEEGREGEEFFQVISNPETAVEIYLNLMKSVKSSALLLLPSSKALTREYKLGVLDHLIQISKNKQSQDIRISCPVDDDNAQIIRWLNEKAPNIKILNNSINLATKIFIVNDDTLFRIELRDPEADTFPNAFGFAVYSNNKSTVYTFKSLFELVWHSYETSEKLHQADKVQREFINTAAHELRTPIVPILNLSELLYSKMKELLLREKVEEEGQEDEDEEGKEQQQKEMLEMAEIILRNANRLHLLTEDILDVTRIESHTLKLRKEKFNLNEEILNIIDDYRKQAENTNGNVRVVYEPATYDSGVTLVEADKRRIAQVISNLLNNATKFTKEGTITITTRVIKRKNIDRIREGEEAAELFVAVKDTGTGIDPELMPRLFTKFATKSYQGTGLGLFISKSIIEAHGGRIWAENNNNNSNNYNKRQHGATFYFTLPVADR